MGGGGYLGSVQKGSNPLIQSAFKDMRELGLELEGRYYFTPEHTMVGLYAMAGLRWGLVTWNYKNPIVLEDENGGEETVETDWVQVFSPRVGLDNDLFNAVGFTQLVLEGSIFFGD